jgi:hypothetical protein
LEHVSAPIGTLDLPADLVPHSLFDHGMRKAGYEAVSVVIGGPVVLNLG